MQDKCFACGRKIRGDAKLATTAEGGQVVYVGPDCHKKIVACASRHYRPYRGVPELRQTTLDDLMRLILV